MKKFLSIMMVLVMMLTFIPAAFAMSDVENVTTGTLETENSDPAMKTFIKATTIEDGKNYVFAGQSGSSDKGYLLSSGSTQKFEVTPKPSEDPDATISVSENKAADVTWKAIKNADGTFSFKCGDKYLSIKSDNTVETFSDAVKFTVDDAQIKSGNLVLCYGKPNLGDTYIFNFNNTGTNSKAVIVYENQNDSDEGSQETNEQQQDTTENTSADSEKKCGDNLTWEFVEGTGILTISGTGPMYDYEMAYNITTAPWKEFYNQIEEVVIEEGATTIGEYAFAVCSQKKVSIPETVTSIGGQAFEYNVNLEEIIVDEDNSNFCAVENVLFDKNKTKLILFPAKKTGSYSIPNTVTDIEPAAFNQSKIDSVVIPNSVKNIGSEAFASSNIGPVTIPDDVTKIQVMTFAGCQNLKSITIPSSVKELGDGAFRASGIESIIIPSGVTVIPDFAFMGCGELEAVTIPASVTSIGRSAFNIGSHPKLEDIYFNGTEDQWKAIQINNEGNDILNEVTIHYDTPVDPTIISVVITDPTTEAFSLGSVGELAVFKASVNPEKGADGKQHKIDWTSSNTNIVTVYANEYGTEAYIYANGAGSATVTASCGEKNDTVTVYVVSDYKFTAPTGKLIWYYDRNPQYNLEFSTSIPYQGIQRVVIQAGNRDYDFTGAAMQNTYGTVTIPYSALYGTFGRQTTTMTVKVYYGPGANDYIYKNLYYRSIYDAPLTADTDMTWAYITLLISGLFITASPFVLKKKHQN